MPPVVIGVAAAAAASTLAGVGVLTAVAIGVGAAVATRTVLDGLVPEFDVGGVSPVTEQEISTNANQPKRIVYGEVLLGGQLIGYGRSEGNQNFNTLVIQLVGHPCESVELFQIEGQDASTLTSHVQTQYFTGEQTAVSSLALANVNGWTTNHIGYGQTYAVIRVREDAEKFPNGLNNITFKVRGKRLYDPRKDSTQGFTGTHRREEPATWEYSSNPILCAYDYVRFHGSTDMHDRRIPWDWVAVAADYCDELAAFTLPRVIEQFEKRFTCNGILTNAQTPATGLKRIMQSCGAKMYRPNNRIYIKPAMYIGPATVTLTPDDFASQPEYIPHRPLREKSNVVRAEYVEPDLNYQVTKSPIVTNPVYVENDGRELDAMLKLHMTQRSTVAQRLSRIHMERSQA